MHLKTPDNMPDGNNATNAEQHEKCVYFSIGWHLGNVNIRIAKKNGPKNAREKKEIKRGDLIKDIFFRRLDFRQTAVALAFLPSPTPFGFRIL